LHITGTFLQGYAGERTAARATEQDVGWVSRLLGAPAKQAS